METAAKESKKDYKSLKGTCEGTKKYKKKMEELKSEWVIPLLDY